MRKERTVDEVEQRVEAAFKIRACLKAVSAVIVDPSPENLQSALEANERLPSLLHQFAGAASQGRNDRTRARPVPRQRIPQSE